MSEVTWKDSWDKTEVDVGTHKPGKKVEAQFVYKGTDKIVGVHSGCSCTVLGFDDNVVRVMYKIPDISPLKNTPLQTVKKDISVNLINKDEHQYSNVLIIKATRDGR